jgi:hypothetical protein
LHSNARYRRTKDACRKHNKKEKERARNLEEELAALKAEKKNAKKIPLHVLPALLDTIQLQLRILRWTFHSLHSKK